MSKSNRGASQFFEESIDHESDETYRSSLAFIFVLVDDLSKDASAQLRIPKNLGGISFYHYY